MKATDIVERNKIVTLGYKYMAKPILIAQDPEKVHDNLTNI